MIDKNNYSEKIKDYNVDEFPPTIKKSFDFVEKNTKRGTDWKMYDSSEPIRKMIDLYFQKLSELPKKKH